MLCIFVFAHFFDDIDQFLILYSKDFNLFSQLLLLFLVWLPVPVVFRNHVYDIP